MEYAEWKEQMLAAANVTPYLEVQVAEVELFCEACRYYGVNAWDSPRQLRQSNGNWYVMTDDHMYGRLPFEDWEYGQLDYTKWMALALNGGELDFASIVLQSVHDFHPSPERHGVVYTGVVDLRVSYDQWLESLPAKNRYHVKVGLKHDLGVSWKDSKDLPEEWVRKWLVATSLAHPEASLHAAALILWQLSKATTEVLVLQGDEFQAAAGFVKSGFNRVFGFNVRTDSRSDIGQRLLTEAVRRYHLSRYVMLDVTERTLLLNTESYAVYKRKVCNLSIPKYAVTAVSKEVPHFTPPYFRKDLNEWVSK